MRVLVAGQRHDIWSLLRGEGMIVEEAEDREDISIFIQHYDTDLVLLTPGFAHKTVAAIRAMKVDVPIVVLGETPEWEPAAAIRCLRAGADDWQPLDIDLRELLHRIHAVARRYRGQATSVITVGPLELDTARMVWSADGQVIRLTPRLYRVVEVMMKRPELAVPRETLISHCHPGDMDRSASGLAVAVVEIRKKMGPYAGMLQTIWGFGYRLSASMPAEVKTVPAAPNDVPPRVCYEPEILRALDEKPMTRNELAGRIDISYSTVAAGTQRLRRKGLIGSEEVTGVRKWQRGAPYKIYSITNLGRSWLQQVEARA